MAYTSQIEFPFAVSIVSGTLKELILSSLSESVYLSLCYQTIWNPYQTIWDPYNFTWNPHHLTGYCLIIPVVVRIGYHSY